MVLSESRLSWILLLDMLDPQLLFLFLVCFWVLVSGNSCVSKGVVLDAKNKLIGSSTRAAEYREATIQKTLILQGQEHFFFMIGKFIKSFCRFVFERTNLIHENLPIFCCYLAQYSLKNAIFIFKIILKFIFKIKL